MASDTDICNLALSHLGDDSTVSQVFPIPEKSIQAKRCFIFYPLARDSLLEKHNWTFITTRVKLALLSAAPPSSWQYMYAAPDGLLKVIAVIPPDAQDDYSVSFPPVSASSSGIQFPESESLGAYTPQPYVTELDPSTGKKVILTNQPDAVLRFTTRLGTDPTRFSPLFVDALAWLLASYLAGPMLKGEVGAAESKRCLQMAEGIGRQAMMSDANQRLVQPTVNTPWITGR